LIAVMVIGRTFDPFTGVFILLVVALLFLHLGRSDVFRTARPVDGKLTVLALVAAVPLWAYAFSEISRHLNAPAGDPHADLAHYAGTAAAAIAIPLVGLVASFRTPGSTLSLWCAGLGGYRPRRGRNRFPRPVI
jgi:purine-cytosine permease-like protein